MRKLFLIGLLLQVAFVGNAQQIELAVQKGHSGDVQAISFSADTKLLASAGADHLIKLWHVATGKEMASFISASASQVEHLEFSTENDFLTVQYKDQSVHTWDVASSSLKSIISSTIKFTGQNHYYAKDSSFHIFVDRYFIRKTDLLTGKLLFSRVPIDISKNFKCVAVSERNKIVIAGSEDGKVYVWDLEKGKSLAIVDGHYSSVNSISLASDETLFATGSADRSIILWRTNDRQPIKRLYGHSFRFESLAFNHAGTQLVVGDELGKVRIIDLLSSRVKISVHQWHGQKVSALQFSGDDSVIHSGGYDNRHTTFKVLTEQFEKNVYQHYVSPGDLMLKKLKVYRDPYAWINTIAVSPKNQWVAYGGGWRESEVRKQPQKIVVQNIGNEKSTKLLSHQGSVNDVVFLNEISFLSGGSDGLLQWYIDEASGDYYYRKKNTGLTNINSIIPLSNDTVLLHSGNAIVLYNLATEVMIDSIQTNAEITAVAFDKKTGGLTYSIFNKLVFTTLQNWHQKPTINTNAHTDKITSIAFNPTRKIVATCSWDATVKLWNSESGQLIATIITIGTDDHLIITPDNYYYGTRNALRGIGFKFGKQFISPEQYDLRFNRPDLVLSRLGFVQKEIVRSFERAYQKRLQKMNFSEQMLSAEIHLPEIQPLANLPLATSKSNLSLKIEASDSKYKLDRINIFVNNVSVHGLDGINLRDQQISSITHDVDIALSSGKNKIQISCLNEKGVASLLQTFELTYTPDKVVQPRLYVAVISVSHYANAAMDLKYARKDGQDLADMFQRSKSFQNVSIDSLYDARATRENILRLREKFMKTTVDDQVIVFISGHGLLDEKLDFYFATHDIDFKNPATGGLRYEELEGLLDGIPARKKLLLMDACHSGEVDKARLKSSVSTSGVAKNTKGSVTEYTYPADIQDERHQIGITTSFELMQELFANLSKGSGAVVISAAAGNSYALESDEWRNGVFTYALLSGLKTGGADKDRDGKITVSELKEFVSKEVQRLTKGAQKPTSRSENLEFDFRIW